MRFILLLLVITLSAQAADLRVGMIGLDTSHTVAFAKILNDPKAPGYIPGAVITGAFRSGSPDIPVHSMNRVEGYATELSTRYGVKLYDTIEELLANCDVVMIENVDGRKHLEIARIVFPTGKPTFIDKPLAGSLDEGIELVQLAERYQVPFFSASSLRFADQVTKLTEQKRASIRGAMAYSPCEYEPHHPDLFWYGIHGVETLYALLGTGCETVTRVQAPSGDVVTGRWADGRLGTFYGYRQAKAGYGYKAITTDGVVNEDFSPDYVPLLRQVVTFFQTRRAPVGPTEMIEVLAFMEAADESKRREGTPVSLAEIMAKHGAMAGTRHAP